MIVKGLFEKGVHDHNGRPLSRQTVKRMLLNPRYAGILAIGARQKGKYHRVAADGCWAPVGPSDKSRSSARACIEIPGRTKD